ncbi:MAG: BON domain-containing protein [Acidobacteriota bacterium]
MRRTIEFCILASSLLVWMACSSAPARPEAAKLSDSDVEQAIKSRINENAVLRATNVDVDADVDKKSVTLSGTVDSEAVRTQLVDVARSTEPGFVVNDKIDVKPLDVPLDKYTEDMATQAREKAQHAGEKLGNSLEDAWLHTKVTAKLAANKTTPAHKINVDVEGKVVTLRGDVESSDAKTEAARVARETEGVRRVVNLLKVKS